jgi:hypothetical protein
MAEKFQVSAWTAVCVIVALARPALGTAVDTSPHDLTPSRILAEAKREAIRISSLESRAVAFCEIALRMEAHDRQESDRLWEMAEECAKAVEDDVSRVMAQRSVAQRTLRSARRDVASRQLESAYQAAVSLPVASHRAVVLCELYTVLSSVQSPLASEALAKAVQAANEVPEPLVRAAILSRVAQAQASDDIKGATATAQRAEQAWRLANDDMERELAASELVGAWAVLDWEHALDIASELKDVQAKAHAFRSAAEVISGNSLEKALIAVRQMPAPELRALGLAVVAERAASERPELGALMAKEALTLAKTAPSAIRDVVAEHCASALAVTAPDEAREVVQSISDGVQRARALGSVARTIAPRDPELAAELIRSSDHPEMVEKCWLDVVGAMARESPVAAKALVKHILDRYLRTIALLRICDAMTEAAVTEVGQQQGGTER